MHEAVHVQGNTVLVHDSEQLFLTYQSVRSLLEL